MEHEAEAYAEKYKTASPQEQSRIALAYLDGLKHGEEHNKANEWHYVKDGDLPKEESRPRTHGYYLTALKHKSYKWFVFEVAYFTGVVFTRGGNILDNVYAWKEIVLPKELAK
jgi:hypothetical protein